MVVIITSIVVIMKGFLRLLENKQQARKIFGKRELVIIEKQLQGINLTQSEKNRLSRDIRPKFSFMMEAAPFTWLFKMKKGELIKHAIAEARDLILADQQASHIQRIILYGSTVVQQRTFRSDVDLAVEFSEITEKDAIAFRKRSIIHAPEKVDIQVYNLLPQKIKKEIEETGKIIYENKKN